MEQQQQQHINMTINTNNKFSPIIVTDGRTTTTIDTDSTMNIENLEITPMVAVSNEEAATSAMEVLLSSMPSPPICTQAWPSSSSSGGCQNNNEYNAYEYEEEVKDNDDVQMTNDINMSAMRSRSKSFSVQPAQLVKSNYEEEITSMLPVKDFSLGTNTLTSKSGMTASTSSNSLNGLAISRSNSSDALSRSLSGNSLSMLGTNPTVRRQRRLERNRESARLSRRRRKQYLEVLEEKVATLGEQMDSGRQLHVASAISTITAMRDRLFTVVENELRQKENGAMSYHEGNIQAMSGPLSYASDELRVAADFQKEQLRCIALPSHSKFVLWLTLQNDAFFRGGRSASERLSAARIGEKLLSSGNMQASPSNGMWPLFCHEVGLSYDQEDKVRALQRTLLSNCSSWLDRRTCKASESVLYSSNSCINGVSQMVQQRLKSGTRSLTNEQKLRFLIWAQKNKEQFAAKISKKSPSYEEIGLLSEKHVATNLVTLDRRLQRIKVGLPHVRSLVPGHVLKKFRKRPTFESLGGSKDITASTSATSLSSLKKVNSTGFLSDRPSNITSFQDNIPESIVALPSFSPEEAQLAVKDEVIRALGEESVEATTVPILREPQRVIDVSYMDIDPIPLTVKSTETTAAQNSFVDSNAFSHQGDNSNLVQDDDILFNLIDEDWAIGFDIEQ